MDIGSRFACNIHGRRAKTKQNVRDRAAQKSARAAGPYYNVENLLNDSIICAYVLA